MTSRAKPPAWKLMAIVLLQWAVVFVSSPSSVSAQSIHSTISRVSRRTVKVFGAGGIRRLHSYSTGFVVSSRGHVATIWSHVLDTEELTVVLPDGRKVRAKVLGAEPQLDLAVLELEAENLDLPAWDLEAEVSDAGPGTRVLGFSNMFRVATGDEMVSVLHGVVAAKAPLATRRGAFETSYEGTAFIVDAVTNNPGAGGGVLTTRSGRLLGMIGKELRNAESNTWVNYAVPISELKRPIQEIIAGKYRARQREPDETDSVARFTPLEFGIVLVPDVLFRTPAFIDRVQPSSAAAAAGLRPDDLVLFINGDLVQSCRVFKQRLGRIESGGVLKLTVRRGDKLVPVELPVPAKPATVKDETR
ncbi:MAG: trypsin-like peptidase domain-containing protein [Planctomycetaceae bacterium]